MVWVVLRRGGIRGWFLGESVMKMIVVCLRFIDKRDVFEKMVVNVIMIY